MMISCSGHLISNFPEQRFHRIRIFTLKQLTAIGIDNAEIITDNGYYSEKNLADLLSAHFDFITLIKVSIGWVKAELKEHIGEFRSISSACPSMSARME